MKKARNTINAHKRAVRARMAAPKDMEAYEVERGRLIEVLLCRPQNKAEAWRLVDHLGWYARKGITYEVSPLTLVITQLTEAVCRGDFD